MAGFKSDKQRKAFFASKGQRNFSGIKVTRKNNPIKKSKNTEFAVVSLRKGEKIPAFTGTLGKAQSSSKAQQFRIWTADKLGGDDSFFEYSSLEKAKKGRKRLLKQKQITKVEPIIGVSKGNVSKFPTQKYWEFALKK